MYQPSHELAFPYLRFDINTSKILILSKILFKNLKLKLKLQLKL